MEFVLSETMFAGLNPNSVMVITFVTLDIYVILILIPMVFRDEGGIFNLELVRDPGEWALR